jgi:hypothetical protein
MKYDKRYSKSLLTPFRGQFFLNISDYFKSLDKLKVEIFCEGNVHVSTKFIEHFNSLVENGILYNQNRSHSLKEFGIYIGSDNTLSLIASHNIYVDKKALKKGYLVKIIKYVILSLATPIVVAFIIKMFKLNS